MIDSDPAFVAPKHWRQFSDCAVGPEGTSVWLSEADDDPVWDAFLLGTPLGQFQQSSAWARVKRLEGWRATRFMVTAGERIVTGFQILWKTRFGLRFGYVSKGPVVMAVPGFGPIEATTTGGRQEAGQFTQVERCEFLG